MSLGKRIKELRTKKGLLQKELATLASITQKSLSTYESELATPDANVLKRLADSLQTTTDYLVGSASVELNNPDYVTLLNEVDKLPEKEKDAILTTLKTFLSAYQKSKKK